ncbi:MAG TPA: hypothetical protein VGG78_01410 [Gemmatimonadaceae bacterium]|jgi:hypothetical protein
MARYTFVRRDVRVVRDSLGRRLTLGQVALALLSTVVLLAASPRLADAQFGALRKLKDRVTGVDSATRVKDSLAQDSLAKVRRVSGGDVALPPDTATKQSLFSRARAVAGKATDKAQSVTGLSAKDAALAVSGVGLVGIAAKKAGVDPASLAAKAMNKVGVDPSALASNAMGKVTSAAQQKAMRGQGVPTAIPGDSTRAQGVQLQAMQAQAMQAQAMQAKAAAAQTGARRQSVGSSPMTGAMYGTTPDAQLMLDFQRSMSQTAMDASNGSEPARAKLEAWQVMSAKYTVDAQKLSASAAGGDMTAYAKLQQTQLALMRDWLNRYGGKP